MKDNSVLNSAQYSNTNTDEWYTPYFIVEEEVARYKEQFENKTVLCNCDDPFGSNFCYFFLKNFNKYKLKKLICTSYADSRIEQINDRFKLKNKLFYENGEEVKTGQGYVLEVENISERKEEISDEDIYFVLSQKGAIKKLEGDGDFRSKECLKYLDECDICCTNPPFSLFSELFELIIERNKSFLLIGNQNAITYKSIFPLIKKNKIWVGYRFGEMPFRVPSNTEPRKTRYWVDQKGQKWRSIGNAMWLTNMETSRKKNRLELTKRFSPDFYFKYDNYDGIHVEKVADIPYDYDGVMGVPITYIKYHNEVQFEIVGEANHGSDNEFDLFKPVVNGKEVFKRILIKRKDFDND